MITHRAGDTVHYRVTWLEMQARPSYDWPKLPSGHDAALLRADAPPAWFFLTLYDAVGRDYAWTDKHALPEPEIEAWIQHPDVSIWTLMRQGWPAGFFMLDWRETGICDLAYFGLVPQAVGLGLGSFLLKTAIRTGWSREGVEKMTVNTCTLDHPRALIQYQRQDFVPVRTEEHSRVLTRDAVFHQPLL